MTTFKSSKSIIQSRVTFKNITERKASLFWLDYNGERVLYKKLGSGEETKMNTFVGHPWVFRDSDSGDELVAGEGKKVLWPEEWREGSPNTVVTINIPGQIND